MRSSGRPSRFEGLAAVRVWILGHFFGWPAIVLPDLKARAEVIEVLATTAFWLAVILWIGSYIFMARVPLSGDETTYAKHAKALADFLAFRGVGFNEALAIIVDKGWFMPGLPISLLPIFLIGGEPSIAIVRLYASILTLVLWMWWVRGQPGSGPWCAGMLLICPPLIVTWQLFSATIWGDLPAGLLLAVIFARTWSIAISALRGATPGFRETVVLELLLAVAIYVRGSYRRRCSCHPSISRRDLPRQRAMATARRPYWTACSRRGGSSWDDRPRGASQPLKSWEAECLQLRHYRSRSRLRLATITASASADVPKKKSFFWGIQFFARLCRRTQSEYTGRPRQDGLSLR